MITKLNDNNFETEVLGSKQPVMIDVWAEWCGPCKRLAPTVDELAEEFNGKVKICKLNIDEGMKTAGMLSVRSVPTILFFKEGKEIDRISGALPKDVFVEKLSRL